MKVLYLGVGDPVLSRSGMDRVVKVHLCELGAAKDFSVDAVVVVPGEGVGTVEGVFPFENAKVKIFVGDLKRESRPVARALDKLKLVLSKAVPVTAYAFKSERAQIYIKDRLQYGGYDLVVLDHFYALANVRFKDLLKFGGGRIYISHDSMGGLLSCVRQSEGNLFKKLYTQVEMVRAKLIEAKLFSSSSVVVHLSSYECEQARMNGGNHISLLPSIPTTPTIAGEIEQFGDLSKLVVFIGATTYFPNAEAIAWLVGKLAPAMLKRSPHLKIALIGAGTDKLNLPVNVIGCGFLADEHVKHVLGRCLCTISPVVYGHGIKVKVLESIAAGCPVLATPESLRGLGGFGLDSMVDVNSPDLTALNIQKLSDSPNSRDAIRLDILSSWGYFCETRRGMLNQVLRDA